MKKMILMVAVLLGIGSQSTVFAQRTTNVVIQIQGNQPDWGPFSYSEANFYYIPAMDVYYDIVNSLFYYLNGSRWVSVRTLPSRYSRYDLYSIYKVPLKGSNHPWYQHNSHKQKYASYVNVKSNQRNFRDAKKNPSINSHRNEAGSGTNKNNRVEAKPSNSYNSNRGNISNNNNSNRNQRPSSTNNNGSGSRNQRK